MEHLKRCKTSFGSMMVDFRGFSLLNHICRGHAAIMQTHANEAMRDGGSRG